MAAFATWIWGEIETETRRHRSQKYTDKSSAPSCACAQSGGSAPPSSAGLFSWRSHHVHSAFSGIGPKMPLMKHQEGWEMHDLMALAGWLHAGTQEHKPACWYLTISKIWQDEISSWARRKGIYQLDSLQSTTAGPGSAAWCLKWWSSSVVIMSQLRETWMLPCLGKNNSFVAHSFKAKATEVGRGE